MLFINMLVNKLTKTTFNKCSFSWLFGKVCKQSPPNQCKLKTEVTTWSQFNITDKTGRYIRLMDKSKMH